MKAQLLSILIAIISFQAISQPPVHHAGKVGIGTGSPEKLLHLKSTNDSPYILFERANNNFESGLFFRTGANPDFFFFVENGKADSPLQIVASGLTGETDDNPRISIPKTSKNLLLGLSGGKIGVGTNNPQKLLHLKSLTESPFLRIERANNNFESGVVFSTNNENDFFFFVDDKKADSPLQISASNLTGENDHNPRISIPKTNKNLFLALSGGKVGVGTNNPQKLLHLKSSTESPFLRIERANNNFESGVVFSTNNENDFFFFVDDKKADSPLQISASNLTGENDHNPRISIPKTNKNLFLALSGGKVGVGTTKIDDNYKMAVNGLIKTKEVKVTSQGWYDFVFERDYDLRTLEEVEGYIHENKHLPEIPSEAEVLENGIHLGEMNGKLLQKIEELTLYLIEQNKQNKEQQKRIEALEQELQKLKK